MDLRQKRLTGEEWNSLEVPVSKDELKILKLINKGYEDVSLSYNETTSMIGFIKISNDIELYHEYFYENYFKTSINTFYSKSKCPPFKSKKKKRKKKKIKTADKIRIANAHSKIEKVKSKIYEFILINILNKILTKDSHKRSFYYYTLTILKSYNIHNINTILIENIDHILNYYKQHIKKRELIKYSKQFIESNKYLNKYRDIRLYDHQKQLFTYCKNPNPKLILYQAPTGTGKTISPLGLVKNNKIIFVCAAKHVGLQLAKALISMEVKIAVAFGCEDPGGIRLHYFAAKEYVRNRRSGGIFRVDNSVGDNVEIIISDVMSYLPSMRYMLAFNKKEDIVWYWDEPTITLDYKDHEYHKLLQKNWQENEIPNIVLSSATLPSQEDIGPCIQSFITKFNSTNVNSICSNHCEKTIPIMDTNNQIVLPHFIFPKYDQLKESLRHIKKNQTLLRHFDIGELIKFIVYVNNECDIRENCKISNYFENISDITSISIKQYYLHLLKIVKNKYEGIYKYFNNQRAKKYDSMIFVTTKDSYTLTDGPTIYLADDVEKIGKFCIYTSNITDEVLGSIIKNINYNESIRKRIAQLEKDITKNQDESKKGESDKKQLREFQRGGDNDKREKLIQNKIDYLRRQIKTVQLPAEYIPNSFEHLKKWDHSKSNTAFRSTISDSIIERIMLLEVLPMWKILLMMGIGVFTKHECVDYVAIMKELAHTQKLYLIIASTDYIYGTNYQFCHGYIGKDLGNLTQEKLIQAFGRVGRKNVMADYSLRLRNDDIILKLFTKSHNNIEVDNMNRLFN